MKPVLIVDGKRYPIKSTTVETEGGIDRIYFDANKYSYLDDVVDFATAIENPNQTQQTIKRIQNTIYETREYLKDLKVQVANIVIENFDSPFSDIVLAPIIEEIKSTVSYIEGLECALEVLKGGE